MTPQCFRRTLCGAIVPDTWVPLGAPRRPCVPAMIWHLGERHHEEFLRRTEPMCTTDELGAVLGPLFELGENEAGPPAGA
jgi:hypothetical protein